jgi:hypothetical protein
LFDGLQRAHIARNEREYRDANATLDKYSKDGVLKDPWGNRACHGRVAGGWSEQILVKATGKMGEDYEERGDATEAL